MDYITDKSAVTNLTKEVKNWERKVEIASITKRSPSKTAKK